ncbi:MAG: methionine--tRNA ligase [Anaerolineae bacterium]|nr:methionine--tRNA ligase [Anaerolineae bacterium]
MSQKILVCVAWPYANGRVHLGHIAGAYLPPDIFSRYHRLAGNEVLHVTGSDTHGTPITIRAEEEGITPAEVVERYHADQVEAFQKLGITFDLYTHTDTENHWAVTTDMFLTLLDHGYVYRDTQRGLYCAQCDKWLPDRYVEGTCPHCHAEGARGDQCDACGRTIDAVELIDPRCKLCGALPEVRDTEHYFLDLGKANGPLLEWMAHDKAHWRPNVFNFTMQVLQSGELRGRPITRDISWGIPVPVEGFEDKRIYVWFDAVIGYLAASVEWAKITGQPDAWRRWWQDEDARSYYFIGKDNITFHTIIWPAMLYGYGGLNLPYDVPSNEYLNVEGRKLSKSRRWMIETLDYLSRYDPDPLRYYLTINAPEAKDVNFAWDDFVRRNNDELVATWGNLANRMLSFAHKRYGEVPTPGALDATDRALLDRVAGAFDQVGDLIGACKFKAALTEIMAVAHEANRYLDEKAPWFQIKTDPQAAATTVFVILRAIDSLKTLLTPFLPHTCQRLHAYLGYEGSIVGRIYTETLQEEERQHLAIRYDASDLQGTWAPSALPVGQALRPPAPLFVKLDESVVEEEHARLGG